MSTTEVRPIESLSPWERWGWAIAGIWLVFLFYPVSETLQVDVPVGVKILGLAILATFAVVYLLGYSYLHEHATKVWIALLLLGLAIVPIIGIEAIGLTPYLGAYSAIIVPAPWWKWTTAISAALPLLSLYAGDFPTFFFLTVWPIIGFCLVTRIFTDVGERAEASRATLAIVAERDRVARDVHDVLGHSLTVLSVKAELAGRLIDIDPERAKAELASIQDTARQALAEVRATVGGLRAGNLEAEIAAAPQVLADAGIKTKINGAVADTDPRHRALLAWVLREAVTNVVRHSRAHAVTVELRADGLRVSDDGQGLNGSEGNGLRGMRERVEQAGGTLRLDGSRGTALEVSLP